MAYESYKIGIANYQNPRKQMINEKEEQVRYLYDLATDREDNCLLNGKEFIESPRIFNRLIKTNYYQTLNMETINENDRFKSGDLLTYDNDYWICTSSFIFHNLYCKGNFIRTNYTLRWQNYKGNLVERRAYIISASQYNSGENSDKTLTLGYNQYMIVMSSDEETNILDRTKRFFIDKDKDNPITYRVTRNDTIPYSDWDRGCVCLIVTEDQYNPHTDNIDEWLCDYIKPKSSSECIEITYNGNLTIRIGGQKTFVAKSEATVNWEVVSDNFDVNNLELTADDGENKVIIKCNYNEDLFDNKSFKLICTDINNNKSELLIHLIGGV